MAEPRRVAVRGHDAVSVVAADDLPTTTSDTVPFVAFMESLSLDGLDLTRDRDLGRDLVL
jgi:hypothetical protein